MVILTAMANDTRTRLLELTIEQIEAGGEASVRVDPIAAAAGVTMPVIYHHFGSRDGLVAAAQAERFARNLREDLDRFAEAVADCTAADELRDVFIHWWRRSFAERSTSRWRRINAIGSAYARPELAAAQARTQATFLAGIVAVLAPFQARGWIRHDLDLATAVAWQYGVQLSRAFLEHGVDGIDLDEWDRLSIGAFLDLAFGPAG